MTAKSLHLLLIRLWYVQFRLFGIRFRLPIYTTSSGTYWWPVSCVTGVCRIRRTMFRVFGNMFRNSGAELQRYLPSG